MSDFNLPLLDGTFEVGHEEYVELSMDSLMLTYAIKWPSGYAKDGLTTEQMHTELKGLIPNDERREQVIRYTTDKRRTAFFPHKGPKDRVGFGAQYVIFPGEGTRIYFGGGANSGGLTAANPFAFIDPDTITEGN